MLVIFAGLPGTGKSTIAQPVAAHLGAVYLRIDSIEQAILSSGILPPDGDIGPAGYMTAYRTAADNLRMGRPVVVDSVNPLRITRDAYRAVAVKAGAGFIEVETVCSDRDIHRRRVETRPVDVEGLVLPSWDQVATRPYERWDRPCVRIDTARLSVERSVALILDAVSSGNLPKP